MDGSFPVCPELDGREIARGVVSVDIAVVIESVTATSTKTTQLVVPRSESFGRTGSNQFKPSMIAQPTRLGYRDGGHGLNLHNSTITTPTAISRPASPGKAGASLSLSRSPATGAFSRYFRQI